MALEQTWVAATAFYNITADRDLLNVFNGAASDRVIRVYRIIFSGGQGTMGTTTGTTPRVQIRRYRSVTAGLPSFLTGFDNLAVMNAHTTTSIQQTVTSDATLRECLYSLGVGWGSMLTMVPYGTLWDAGYSGDVQPLTCPIGYNCGYGLWSVNTPTGAIYYEAEIEFTSGAT